MIQEADEAAKLDLRNKGAEQPIPKMMQGKGTGHKQKKDRHPGQRYNSGADHIGQRRMDRPTQEKKRRG